MGGQALAFPPAGDRLDDAHGGRHPARAHGRAQRRALAAARGALPARGLPGDVLSRGHAQQRRQRRTVS